MRQKKVSKMLKALAILLLCIPFSLPAATSDDFIQGYASAVLEREFGIKNFSLKVAGVVVTITSKELSDADHNRILAAVTTIEGVKKVEIVDGSGAVVASSTPRETS
jgi:hypothetical protein